jgi:hypothetical protein
LPSAPSWDALYPDFGHQFIGRIAHDMAVRIHSEATYLAGVIPVHVFEDGIRAQIQKKLQGKPLPTVGTIVGVVSHAYDNKTGLWVTNDLGWKWYAYGDGKLDDSGRGEHNNREVALAAVRAGIYDIQTAHAMGRRDAGTPLPREQVLDQVMQQPHAPASAGNRYGPEQFMPRIDETKNQGTLGWQAGSLEKLWVTKLRSTHATTYGEYIVNDMQPGGDMGAELQELHDTIPEKQDPIPLYAHVIDAAQILNLHGDIYPRRAFKATVLDRVRDPNGCLAFLISVVRT